MGEPDNHCNGAFDSGMTGGRTAEAALLAAGGLSAYEPSVSDLETLNTLLSASPSDLLSLSQELMEMPGGTEAMAGARSLANALISTAEMSPELADALQNIIRLPL
jgi:hypothetical protein